MVGDGPWFDRTGEGFTGIAREWLDERYGASSEGTLIWRGDWETDTEYVVNDLVRHFGTVFQTTQYHTSGEFTNQPGVGEFWTDYWDVLVPQAVAGLPPGGTDGQYIRKSGSTDYLVDWTDPSLVIGITAPTPATGVSVLWVDISGETPQFNVITGE